MKNLDGTGIHRIRGNISQYFRFGSKLDCDFAIRFNLFPFSIFKVNIKSQHTVICLFTFFQCFFSCLILFRVILQY